MQEQQMMDNPIISTILTTLIYFVSLIVGLWVAKGFVVFFTTWIAEKKSENNSMLRLGGVVFWLALGSLFTAPILDILSAAQSILLIVFSPGNINQSESTLEPSLTWFTLVLLVGIYGIVVWVEIQLLKESGRLSEFIRKLTWIEKWFILLVPASLVFQLVRGIIVNVIILPSYDPAFFSALSQFSFFALALGGLLIVAGLITILYLNLKLE
jgi:hypothetical protein